VGAGEEEEEVSDCLRLEIGVVVADAGNGKDVSKMK
jgi:hypothetical protein